MAGNSKPQDAMETAQASMNKGINETLRYSLITTTHSKDRARWLGRSGDWDLKSPNMEHNHKGGTELGL